MFMFRLKLHVQLMIYQNVAVDHEDYQTTVITG